MDQTNVDQATSFLPVNAKPATYPTNNIGAQWDCVINVDWPGAVEPFRKT